MSLEKETVADRIFRASIGIIALTAGIVGFGALFWIEIPARNENALMFAMGIVFGWGSAVIASEYGATTTGRKAAESAIRQIENQGSEPAGTDADPVKTEITNSKKHPVNVKDSK
jgi:hypothetical protein